MSRRLTKQDCGISGCMRAVYRQDLCRAHYALLPLDANLQRAADAMMRAHNEAKARRGEVVAQVQAIVDGDASR